MDSRELEKLKMLARLSIADEELQMLQKDLGAILEYISKIREVRTDVGALLMDEHRNVFREDEGPHETGIYTKILLQEAPNHEGSYVKVKKIL